jgi:ATP-dependent helicase/nuclease subunit B
VQQLQSEPESSIQGLDARVQRPVALQPTHPPQPSGALLPVTTLTQGAYDDLRHCPYRFFALRQLGLQPVDELESEVDKRDFGVWLHAVLDHFHAALAEQPEVPLPERLRLLEASALEATRSMDLPDGEFLPFAAAWPAVRDGYLEWLAEHEGETRAVFQSGEAEQRQGLGELTIKGRVDRIDRLPDGEVMVLDYKTESLDKTRARTRDPLEDTQMAFYAALLPHDTLRGAYVNISEKQTTLLEQTDLVAARDALIEGMLEDVQRVAAGTPLPALGQGTVCDYCQGRGLCRRDFWTPTEGAAQ